MTALYAHVTYVPYLAVTAGLAVLLGLVLLLRGVDAALKTCGLIGAVHVLLGFVTGRPSWFVTGSVILVTVAWASWPWMERRRG